MHTDAIQSSQNILLIDDLLATGGTAEAAVDMINKCDGNLVYASFVIELLELNGRNKLGGTPVYSIL